jgi:hypothetical protein
MAFELLKGLPAALIVLVLGLLAAGIAYRRVQVAQARLKFDLFDRRFALFLEVKKVLSDVAGSGVYRAGGLLSPFNAIIPQAAFLFGPDVERYLQKAVRQWVALWALQMQPPEGGAGVQPSDIIQAAKLTRWFAQEANEGAKQLFGKYLDLSRWH